MVEFVLMLVAVFLFGVALTGQKSGSTGFWLSLIAVGLTIAALVLRSGY